MSSPLGPTTGYPAEYNPSTYTGPTAEPGTPLPGRDPTLSGLVPDYAAFSHGYPYLPPPFNVAFFDLNIAVGNGAEGTWTVPAGCLALPQSVFGNLVTDATVGTRDLSVEYRSPDGNHLFEANVNVASFTATTNRPFSLSINGPPAYINDGEVYGPLPWIWLFEGCKFGLATGGTGGTGDKFTNGPHVSVLLMPRPRDFYPPITDRS